jgi:hypothetical protein
MKKGSVQLCLILLAITGIHAIKIMRNSRERGRVLPLKEIKSEIMLSGQDSLSNTADYAPVSGGGNVNVLKTFENTSENYMLFPLQVLID